MLDLLKLLEASGKRHSHLCPRQVLGARIGLAGAAALRLGLPRRDKRLLVILETDGCFADGVEIATGCTVGHRTLRIEDYGKIAATFVEVEAERAVRVAPQLDVRQRADAYAPEAPDAYCAQLRGYQIMPDAELLSITPVQILASIQQLISQPGLRINCTGCGEEIINQREVISPDGQVLCYACAHGGYCASTMLLSESQIALPD